MKNLLTIILMLLITTSTLTAKTIYVKTNGNDSNNGNSWATAYKTLQKALENAAAEDEIWVANGTYKPTVKAGNGTQDRDMAFVLVPDVKLYGGFVGTETSLSQRQLPPFGTPSATILSGDLDNSGTISDGDAYHVVISAGNVGTACLDGFTITEGVTYIGMESNISVNEQIIERSYGGGIICINSSPIFTNVTISGNYASGTRGYGGGMYNKNSSPTLTNVVISNNIADGFGGGMRNNNSTPELTHVIISGNTTTGSSSSGGGMYNSNSSITLVNATIENNTASLSGGGIFNYESSPVLTNVTISSNTASGNSGDTDGGGGMYNLSNSSPVLTGVIFYENIAAYNGGGLCNLFSSPVLLDVTIYENTAGKNGGGIYNRSSSPVLTDVTISGNEAANDGGGMCNQSNSSPSLTNITIMNNTAMNGGGIYNYYYSSPTLANVKISKNSATGHSGGGMVNTVSSAPILEHVEISENVATDGGGMYNSSSALPVLTNVTISRNEAINGGGMHNTGSRTVPELSNVEISENVATNGGGMYNSSSSPILTNVTISGNTANTNGGGMFNLNYSLPMLTNVVISGNAALSSDGSGGGINNHDNSSPTLTNVTIVGNYAAYIGGGINNNNSSPILQNTILLGNNTGVFNDDSSGVCNPSYSHCLIQDFNPEGEGNLNGTHIYPIMFINAISHSQAPTTDGDYGLAGNSPCINAGNNSYNTSETDIAGNIRIYGGTIDIGAYEDNSTLYYIVTFDSQGGSAVSAQYAIEGETISIPTDPELENHTFCGWFKEANCDNAWNFATDVVISDITLYAKWIHDPYIVTFHTNGGTNVPPMQVTAGTPIGTVICNRPEHSLEGWYRDDFTFTSKWNLESDIVTEDMHLYAKWTVLGIEDLNIPSLNIYPNPATNSITITGISAGNEIRVMDLSGRNVMELRATAEEQTLNIESLSAGMYIIQVGNKIGKLAVK